jgi:parvulin-like peptidyl-prolyl isomerase
MSVLRHSTWVLAPSLILAALGCGVREDVVATVGGHRVDVSSLQAYIDGITDLSWQAVDERVATRLLDQYLDEEVVLAAAGELHGADARVEPGGRSASVRRLLHDVCGPLPPVPGEMIDAEIERRLGQIHAAKAHVRQILLDTEEDAETARQRLDEGESFEEVSRRLSRAANAETGGELGYVVRGTLPEDLEDVVFSLQPGEVSRPVASPAGYHVFQVLDVVDEGPAERSHVELEARKDLTERFAREFTDQCVGRLANEVGVTVHPEHLWFSYDGEYSKGDT